MKKSAPKLTAKQQIIDRLGVNKAVRDKARKKKKDLRAIARKEHPVPTPTYTSEQVRRALKIRDKVWADAIFPFIDGLCRTENTMMDLHNSGPGFPSTFPMDLEEFFAAPGVPEVPPAPSNGDIDMRRETPFGFVHGRWHDLSGQGRPYPGTPVAPMTKELPPFAINPKSWLAPGVQITKRAKLELQHAGVVWEMGDGTISKKQREIAERLGLRTTQVWTQGINFIGKPRPKILTLEQVVEEQRAQRAAEGAQRAKKVPGFDPMTPGTKVPGGNGVWYSRRGRHASRKKTRPQIDDTDGGSRAGGGD